MSIQSIHRIGVISLFFLSLVAGSGNAVARNKFKTKDKSNYVSVSSMYRLNMMLGANIINKRSALSIGGQLGRKIDSDSHWFVGPEVSLSLFSPESILFFMAGIWYETFNQQAKGLGFILGLNAGVVVPEMLARLPDPTYAAHLDLAVAQKVGSYVHIRGQVRPGIVGGLFSLAIHLNVSFLL